MDAYVYILNHGKFGEELIRSAELITGKIDKIKAFSLLPGMSIEKFYDNVQSAIKEDSPSIVLCDLYGGTPSNVAMMLSAKYDFSIICGVNLAMLIELAIARENETNVDELINKVFKTAKESVYLPKNIKESE